MADGQLLDGVWRVINVACAKLQGYAVMICYALRGLHCGPSGLDLAFLKSAPKSEVEESQVKESQ